MMQRFLRRAVPTVGLTVAFFAMGSSAHAVPKDSSQFSFKYEGDALPVSKYEQFGTFSPIGPFTAGPSVNGGILSYNSTIATGQAFWETKKTPGDSQEWSDLISDATGWTFEIRVKVRTTGASGTEGAFRFAVSDGVDYGPADQLDPDARGSYTIVAVRTDGIWTSDGNGVLWDPLAGGQNPNLVDDQFHTYRFAQLPSSSDFKLWVDGQLFLESHGFDYVGPASQPSQNWFGDGGGLAGGVPVEVDYVRWDPTGVYEPSVGLQGDFNGNGMIEGGDFLEWQRAFGASVAAGQGADGSGDGLVDAADLAIWNGAFGSAEQIGTAIPEPSTWCTAGCGLFFAGIVRRFRKAHGGRVFHAHPGRLITMTLKAG